MTEQPTETAVLAPVQTEQQFLGNADPLGRNELPAPAHAVIDIKDPVDLQLQAEIHAGNALHQLQNGYLDAGIAWLQSALAFALNGREAVRTGGTAR